MSAGWDCHAHLFGPYDRYPLSADRSYTPPEAPLTDYLAMLSRLGLSNGVLVHPSAYGDAFSLVLEALDGNKTLRGVLVARPATSLPLHKLREQGVRGFRFSHRSGGNANFAGSASFDDLKAMAPALADAGLHAEIWTDCQALPAIAPALAALASPVIIDHMGGFDVKAGVGEPGFRCLLSLLEKGHVWVKLCAYRNVPHSTDLERGRPFHEAMVRTNPERLVWGSDWPHLRVTPVPDALNLLDTFKRWTADDSLVSRILDLNPSALYR